MNLPGGVFTIPAFTDGKYFVFSYSMLINGLMNGDCIINKFIYHVIDSTTTQNDGGIVQPDIEIADGCFQNAIANRHSNGRDWWIVLPDNHEPQFYRWLLTPSGFIGPDTQYIANPTVNGDPYLGWSEFSPDGKKLLCRDANQGSLVYDFDRCSGLLSNPYLITHPGFYSFCSTFSPNSRFIYANADGFKKLFQYDLYASDIQGSEVLIAEWDGFRDTINKVVAFNYMQHGPDGKLYDWAGDSYFMHVIDFPNRKGVDCHLRQRAVTLPGRIFAANTYYPHYRLGPHDGSSCDTLGINNIPMAMYHYDFEDTLSPMAITFTDASYYEPTSWYWTFGDGSNSTEVNAVHTYSSPGTYTACLIVSNQYGSDTLCREIQIDTVSGVTNLPVIPQIIVNPNPFQDVLQVKLPAIVNGTEPKLQLTDLFGRIVLERGLKDFENIITVSNLPSGIYVWQVEWKGKVTQSGKVMKM